MTYSTEIVTAVLKNEFGVHTYEYCNNIMRSMYRSDLTQGQWELLGPYLVKPLPGMNQLYWPTLCRSKEFGTWVEQMQKRHPPNVVTVALANKMARMIWVMLAHDRQYQKNYINVKPNS